MSARFDAVVIGAGHNGLVTAGYLAKAGQRVLVVERADRVGGAAVTEEVFPGYRVDIGAHRVGGLSGRVVADLGLERLGLRTAVPDPCLFAPSTSDGSLQLGRDPHETARALRELSASDAEAWVSFTELVARATAFIEAVWITTPPDVTGTDIRDLIGAARLGMKLRGLGKEDMVEVVRLLPMSLYEWMEEWFESDLVRGTLAAAATRGLYQGPMAAGTTYTFLHHHVGSKGVICPTRRIEGGLGTLSEALAKACRGLGVEVRTGAEVDRVLVREGEARGVVLADGSEVEAARVVSGVDPRTTFLGLVGPDALSADFVRQLDNIRYKGVCAKVHLALGGLPSFSSRPGEGPHLGGAISIAPSLDYVERAYDDAKFGRLSSAPVLDVSLPSVTDAGLAPEGKHLASVLVHYAPYSLREGGWDEAARDALGDLVVRTLDHYAPGIEGLIEARHVMTPVDIERRFGLSEANIYHGEMTLDQLLFMRPVPSASRYRTPVAGIYLCGAGTHPGGGVTGVPGFNAAREVLRDAKR